MENQPAHTPSDSMDAVPPPPLCLPPEGQGGGEPPGVPSLWNPNAASLWSLLLSPLFGSLLLRANFGALGDAPRVRSATRWAWLTVGLIVGPQLLPERVAVGHLPGIVSLVLLLGCYYALARPHIQEVERRFGSHYPHRPWGKPLGLDVLGFLGLMVVSFLVAALLGQLGFRSAQQLALRAELQDDGQRSTMAFGSVSLADLPVLLEALGNTNRDVAYTAAFRLKRLGEAAVPSLIKGLADADGERRRWSACSLGLIGPAASNAAPALLPLFKDPSKEVRTAAAFAIGRIEPEGGPIRSQLLPEAMDLESGPALFAFVQHENTPGPPICMMRSGGAFWLMDSAKGAGRTSEYDAFYASGQAFLDFVVRPAAERTLIQHSGGETEVSRWIDALGDDVQSQKAVTMLFLMGARAVPALKAALESLDRSTRERAAFALGCMGSEANEAVPELVRMLEREPPDESGHCRTCGAAAFALERIGPAAVGPLLSLLRSDHETASRYAAVALGTKPSPERIDGLVQALADSREPVRVAAALALGKIGGGAQQAVTLLQEYLRRPDGEGALNYAVALERIRGTGEGLPVLAKALGNKDPEVRRAAAAATRALWESPRNPRQPKDANSGGPSGLALEESKLVAALLDARESTPEVRREVMQCLGALPIHSEPALKGLAEGLEDEDRQVQNHAALGLARHGVAGISYFEAALRHTNPTVRRWAVFGLGQFADENAQTEAVRLLVGALSDQSSSNRGVAAEAFSQLAKRPTYAKGVRKPSPARAALPALSERLEDPNIEVRLQVALALSDLDAATPLSDRIISDAAQVPALPPGTRERVKTAMRRGPPPP